MAQKIYKVDIIMCKFFFWMKYQMITGMNKLLYRWNHSRSQNGNFSQTGRNYSQVWKLILTMLKQNTPKRWEIGK